MKLIVLHGVGLVWSEVESHLLGPDTRTLVVTAPSSIPEDIWSPRVVRGTSYSGVEAFHQHLDLCRPLLASGELNEGPMAGDVGVSLQASVDFSATLGLRPLTPLWNDLLAIAAEGRVSSVDVLTGARPETSSLEIVRLFARIQGATFRLRRLRSAAPPRANPASYGRLSRMAPPSGKGSGLTAVMMVYSRKGWKDLLPLVPELWRRGHRVRFLSPRRVSDQSLRQRGLAFEALYAKAPSPLFVARVLAFARRLAWPVPQKYAPLVTADGPLRRGYAALMLASIAEYWGLAHHLVRSLRVDGSSVIVGTDSGSTPCRLLFRHARQQQLASAFVQHGLLVRLRSAKDYFVGQRLLLWGESSARVLAEMGVLGADKAIRVGNSSLEEQLKSVAPVDLGGDPRPMVLVTFGVPGGFISGAEFLRAAREVAQAAQLCQHLRFVVRPHPADHSATWQLISAEHPRARLEISGAGDVLAWIRSAKALLTMVSTTGAEAMVLGIPVFVVNPSGLSLTNDYLECGAAYHANRPGGLVEMLRQVLDGDDPLLASRQKYAHDFVSIEQRSSVERTVDALELIATEKRGAEMLGGSDVA